MFFCAIIWRNIIIRNVLKKYKNLWFSEKKGPKKILIDSNIFFRYMDKIYIPSELENLSLEDTKSLSEIRIILDEKVIDYTYSKNVNKYLLTQIPVDKRENIIDFGCGGGFLLNCIPLDYGMRSYTGLDLARESLDITENNFKDKRDYSIDFQEFSEHLNISMEDKSVSSIISCFVMHFNIFENQILELYRVLKNDGVFVFNNYKSSESDINNKNISLLKKHGFKIKESIKSFKQDGLMKSHKIIIASKSNTTDS